MVKKRSKIKIAEPIEISDPIGELIKRYDKIIYLVIGILVVALSTMIVMTGTLIVDSFHFNSATYREYTRVIKDHDKLIQEDINNQRNIVNLLNEIKEELEKLKSGKK